MANQKDKPCLPKSDIQGIKLSALVCLAVSAFALLLVSYLWMGPEKITRDSLLVQHTSSNRYIVISEFNGMISEYVSRILQLQSSEPETLRGNWKAVQQMDHQLVTWLDYYGKDLSVHSDGVVRLRAAFQVFRKTSENYYHLLESGNLKAASEVLHSELGPSLHELHVFSKEVIENQHQLDRLQQDKLLMKSKSVENYVIAGCIIAILLILLFGVSLVRDQVQYIKFVLGSRFDAKRANDIKSEFLSNITHEIRTSMNGVIGVSHLLLNSNLSEEQKNYGTMIERSAHSLMSLVNDLLDLAEIESGKVPLAEENFDLAAEVYSAIELLYPRAFEKQLTIGCYISPCVPTSVVGDAFRLRQILVNLIGNAIKYTEEGGVQIEVSATIRDSDIYKINFKVQDTGQGLSQEQQKILLEKCDKLGQLKNGGGVGIAIVNELVAKMGGEIGVSSNLGEGAKFWFEIPLQVDVSGATQTLSRTSTKFKNSQIIFVSGRRLLRNVFAKIAGDLAADVYNCRSLDHLRQTLNSHIAMNKKIHLIVDGQLVKGRESLFPQQVRELDTENQIRLILLTNYMDVSSNQTAFDMDYDNLLMEPIHNLSVENSLSGKAHTKSHPVSKCAETAEENERIARMTGVHDWAYKPSVDALRVMAQKPAKENDQNMVEDSHDHIDLTEEVTITAIGQILSESKLKIEKAHKEALQKKEEKQKRQDQDLTALQDQLQAQLSALSSGEDAETKMTQAKKDQEKGQKPTISEQFDFVQKEIEDEQLFARTTMDRGHILVVEDNKVNCKLVEVLLRQWGYEISVAENGQQAVDECKRKRFDLILMDIRMPVKDGLVAAREIKDTVLLNQTTPIIALSADISLDDRARCDDAGMLDFIQKPIQPEKVLDMLEVYCIPFDAPAAHEVS